jgi:hypothetical protein
MGTLYIAFHPNKIDPSNFNLIQVYSISQDTTIKEKQRNDLVDLRHKYCCSESIAGQGTLFPFKYTASG